MSSLVTLCWKVARSLRSILFEFQIKPRKIFNSQRIVDKAVPPLFAWQAFYLSVVSKNEHFFTDKLFACQSLLKLATDKQKACHCKPRVLLTSFFLLSGVGNYTDKLFACQPFIKLLTDKQIPCQAYQKVKKTHALTRKSHVKNQKKWK